MSLTVCGNKTPNPKHFTQITGKNHSIRVRRLASMKHLILILLLAISLPCNARDATNQLVYDADGHELASHSLYYVLPAQKGSGGGGGLEPSDGLVAQVRSEAGLGVAVKFMRLNESSGGNKILLSTDIKISVSFISTYIRPMYWYVAGRSPSSSPESRRLVAVGPENRHLPLPPDEFVFRIERHVGAANGYKLMSCAGKGPCKDLGLYDSKKKTYLATSGSPFVVVFKKKDERLSA